MSAICFKTLFFFAIHWSYVWLYTCTLNWKENNTFASFGACKQNNVTTVCNNPKDFCNIFLFTPQSRSPKAPRVSLKEWEPDGKLAHQNTSRLPDNRKRPCKLGALWQNSECALTLTLGLKNILLHFTATIVLASLALKKQMLWVKGGLSQCQQVPLTMVH